MGESSYIDQLNTLIGNIINSTQENLPSLKISTKNCLEEINNYINKNNLYKQDNNNNDYNISDNNFSNYFIRNIRKKYQLEITNNISNENKIISLGKIICELFLWIIKETNIISLGQIIGIIQDIVETIPLSGLEDIFNIVRDSLKNIDISLITSEKNGKNDKKEKLKLEILFLHNLFLKRIKNNINDKLRGKIFLLFCDIFSISEVSGVNKNGKYSNNQLNDELSNYSNDNDDTVINGEEAKMVIDEIKKEKNEKIEEKKYNNKMEIEEEEKKENKENSKENKEDNKIDDEKSENTLDLNLEKEKNEKKILYDQFWKIEQILINPFMVCKLIYNLYNNKIFYFIAN